MKRLIVKPTVEGLLWHKATDKMNIPYQWVNWWLYQKGEDQLLKHYNDTEHPLYNAILKNQDKVIEDLLSMLGGSDKAQEKLEELLDKKKPSGLHYTYYY